MLTSWLHCCNGDGDNEQWAEATINAIKSWQGSYYDWGFHQDYCLILTITYTWYELRVWDWMVGYQTFPKWRYGEWCHFGCSFFLFSSVDFFTSLLLWISAQYKWYWHGFYPPLEISQVEVEFPRALDPPNGYHTVLISCGTYGFVHLHMLHGCLIVFFTFLLLYGFMQPRGSTSKEGDIVMAWQHVKCLGPGNTCFIYSQLTMSLRSLVIILS